MKERQPDRLPTNKLAVGATIASVVATWAGPVVGEVWPQIAPAVLAGEAMTGALQALVAAVAGMGAAWFVQDKAGIPVQSHD